MNDLNAKKVSKATFLYQRKIHGKPKAGGQTVRHRALITSEDKKRISNEIYEVKMQVWFCSINLRMLEKYEFKS